jgi:hypothetical protein
MDKPIFFNSTINFLSELIDKGSRAAQGSSSKRVDIVGLHILCRIETFLYSPPDNEFALLFFK